MTRSTEDLLGAAQELIDELEEDFACDYGLEEPKDRGQSSGYYAVLDFEGGNAKELARGTLSEMVEWLENHFDHLEKWARA